MHILYYLPCLLTSINFISVYQSKNFLIVYLILPYSCFRARTRWTRVFQWLHFHPLFLCALCNGHAVSHSPSFPRLRFPGKDVYHNAVKSVYDKSASLSFCYQRSMHFFLLFLFHFHLLFPYSFTVSLSSTYSSYISYSFFFFSCLFILFFLLLLSPLSLFGLFVYLFLDQLYINLLS